MSDQIKSIRGMPTLLPEELVKWQFVESQVKQVMNAYAFREIRTPIVERTELFQRTIGESTDVVSKEMYSFKDRKDQSLTLRPEATAGVVRAGIEHGLFYNQTQKLWSMGPMYRYERPQKGRYRQFHQINMEAFGYQGPEIDLEIILMTARIWKALGINSIQLEINSLGTPASRQVYREALVDYFTDHKRSLDEDSMTRLKTNPMRILDSKNPDMKTLILNAPKITDYLDDESKQHFSILLKALESHSIDYKLNPNLVRGLDYYTKTVFEWTSDQLGSQATVCGGGRYDGLVEQLGGKDICGIGCAIGMERLTELVELSVEKAENSQPKIYIVAVGEGAEIHASIMAETIRDENQNYTVEVNMDGGNFKQQFRRADKSGAELAIIVGEQEIEQGTVSLKPLKSDGEQKTVKQEELIGQLDKFFG
ncbi:MAG: histidine--tRNA ligase [Gammaproteobacteria bacterium]|nr:histidine--tRNA ligase [Gammaproteobacteria bacterium]